MGALHILIGVLGGHHESESANLECVTAEGDFVFAGLDAAVVN